MIPKNIGYVICESDFVPDPRTRIVGDGSHDHHGHVRAEAIIQTANEKNRNGRFYPKEELFPQLRAPRTLELLEAGYLRGEMGHPLSKELVRQQTIDEKITSVKFNRLWTEGDNVWAEYQGTNNQYGKSLEQDLLEGCKPAFSLRALGSIETTNRGAEVHGLRIVTWDEIIYPSHPGAYTQRLMTESANVIGSEESIGSSDAFVIPITNDAVINYIKSESANIKYMKESFDFMYDSIVVNENGGNVVLTDKDGNTFVVRLEEAVHNEIMRYTSEVSDYFK